jgi:hypothetical protein
VKRCFSGNDFTKDYFPNTGLSLPQTEQQRTKREKLLEKRKAAMDARLAKIRERKQRKLHGTEADENTQQQEEKKEEISHENNEESDEMFVGAMVERIRNKSTKKAHPNEWERGKIGKECITVSFISTI